MFGYKNFFTIYDKLNGKNKNIYITEDEMTDKNFIIIKKYKSFYSPINGAIFYTVYTGKTSVICR